MLTLITRIVILAIAAVSLNLILGYGGMMSFGHAAYLGIGGYAVGILAFEGFGSGFIQWPVALAASALYALVIGALSLRTRGVYFIMITLAFAQMAYYLVSGLARYGGDDGLTIYKRSNFGGLIDLSNRVQFYYLCLACLFGGIYLIWRIVNSRFGMVVQGVRSNEQRMQAIGFHANRYRLVCFVISGTICGLAGALLANNTDFISPATMYWTRSGDLMVMVILGGMGSLFGPVIGTIVFLVLEEVLSQFTEYWALIMGPLLLLIVLFARGGIKATDNLSLDVARGELHAIIGPNGAGKTTLISQLTGQLMPNSGAIHFGGRDVTGLPSYKRSRLGLARSFQITCLLPDFTAADNVALAAQAHDGHSFRFWGAARKEKHLRDTAQAALTRVGLAQRADVPVSELSHGEQRELELAVALATKPQLLLLDEPMAGLGVTESARMVALLKELRKEVTIVLVEHDMEAVFALADRITVLVYGRVIASGDPDAIRSNEEVKRAYLGEQHAVTRHG
jgi:branched-chain amino acid transport system permease protein